MSPGGSSAVRRFTRCWEELAEVRHAGSAPRLRRARPRWQAPGDPTLEDARALGFRRIFCLTFQVDFFTRHGFSLADPWARPQNPDVYAELLPFLRRREWPSSSTSSGSSPTLWATRTTSHVVKVGHQPRAPSTLNPAEIDTDGAALKSMTAMISSTICSGAFAMSTMQARFISSCRSVKDRRAASVTTTWALLLMSPGGGRACRSDPCPLARRP